MAFLPMLKAENARVYNRSGNRGRGRSTVNATRVTILKEASL